MGPVARWGRSDVADEGEQLVTAQMVEQLARLAQLPLPDERRTALAEQLDRLLGDANAVNAFMEARPDVAPGIRFHDPGPDGDPR